VTEEDEPTLYGTAAGATVLHFPGAASIFFEPPGRSIYTDEDLFAEFVSNTPRTTEIYLRYRQGGMPLPWLVRAGFPPSTARLRRGALP
jgi:hypothetical protein